MGNLDRMKLVGKRIFKVCVAFFLFHIVISAYNYIYVDGEPWYRILWHNYYKDEGRIDKVYIGSSHVYCDINPSLLDVVDEGYHFNLSTPGQCLNGSYHLLKEAAKENRLSHVYLELYYSYSARDNFNGGIDPIEKNKHQNWQNTDFMKPSLNKLLYMSSIGTKEDYADILFAFSRYRSNLDNWDFIKSTIEKKRSESYRLYEWHYEFGDNNGCDDYLGQGYFFSTRKLLDEQRLFEQSIVLAENSIGEKSERYIRKIISFCQRKDIPITLFISPIDNLEIVSTEGYDHYSGLIQEIAAEYGIEFYDFNLAKEEYLPIQDGKYFRDVGHLNCDGAKMYTLFFNEVMSGNYENNKKYFCSSYEEKCKESSPAIFGLYYRDLPVAEENSQLFRRYSIASNCEEGIEYRITVFPNEGEEYVMQNFQKEKSFVLPAEQHGVCTIVCRYVGEKEALQTLKVNY